RAAPRTARFLRRRGPRRHRHVASALPAGPAPRPGARPPEGDVGAVGFTRARQHRGARPGTGPGAAFALRVRIGARTLPPGARRPLPRVLGRSGCPLSGLARRARLLPRPRSALEGDAEAAVRSNGLRAFYG